MTIGLNQEPGVVAAAKDINDACGTSVSASRLVAGERSAHRQLEQALADFYSTEDCLTLVSGHATNVSTIGILVGGDDLIVYDELMHNSALTGAKLSRAAAIGFRHNRLDHLEKVLRDNRAKYKNALIVVEGLYSMDGDLPILGDVRPASDGRWDGGWIYDPEAKSKYDVELTPLGDRKLQVLGYAGMKVFGETMTWTRAPAGLTRCDQSASAAPEAAPLQASKPPVLPAGAGRERETNAAPGASRPRPSTPCRIKIDGLGELIFPCPQ